MADVIPAGDPMAPWCGLCGIEHVGDCPTEAEPRVSRADAEKVVEIAARLTGVPREEFFLADAEHEGLTPGSWSIAYEDWTGDRDWPSMVSETQFDQPSDVPSGLFLEPLTSWGLGVYVEE